MLPEKPTKPEKAPKKPSVKKSKGEAFIDSPLYHDEPVLRIKYFYPVDENRKPPGLACQKCGGEKVRGFVVELNIELEETGERFTDTLVFCEDCMTKHGIAALINTFIRTIDEMAEFETNL